MAAFPIISTSQTTTHILGPLSVTDTVVTISNTPHLMAASVPAPSLSWAETWTSRHLAVNPDHVPASYYLTSKARFTITPSSCAQRCLGWWSSGSACARRRRAFMAEGQALGVAALWLLQTITWIF